MIRIHLESLKVGGPRDLGVPLPIVQITFFLLLFVCLVGRLEMFEIGHLTKTKAKYSNPSLMVDLEEPILKFA